MQILAQTVLPSEILEYFSVVKVEDIGPRLARDESALSNGELYTFVTNHNSHTQERCLVTVVAFTRSEDVIEVLERIDQDEREGVAEVTLRLIFGKNTRKDATRLSMAKWYNKVGEAALHSFNVIVATFYEHDNEIFKFYINSASNEMAGSFNAQIKLFRGTQEV